MEQQMGTKKSTASQKNDTTDTTDAAAAPKAKAKVDPKLAPYTPPATVDGYKVWLKEKGVYRLGTTQRYERIMHILARIRNMNRTDGKVWAPAPDADPGLVTEPPTPPTPEERLAAYERAAKAQHEFLQKIRTERAVAASLSGEQTRARISWKGHPVTSLLRWMGKDGFDVTRAAAACAKLGLTVAIATVRAQVLAGRKGERGPAAALSNDQQKEIRDAAPLTVKQPKVKAEKAAKPAKVEKPAKPAKAEKVEKPSKKADKKADKKAAAKPEKKSSKKSGWKKIAKPEVTPQPEQAFSPEPNETMDAPATTVPVVEGTDPAQ